MVDYRHYFLDRNGHIEAREEFSAPDDATAMHISACVAAASEDQHSGYMLWRGAVLLREAKKADGLDAHLVSAVALDLQAQEITLEFEHRLLRSRWCVAKSRRLLDAARDLENIAKQPDSA